MKPMSLEGEEVMHIDILEMTDGGLGKRGLAPLQECEQNLKT